MALKIQHVDSRYPDLRLKNEVDRAASLRHTKIARYKECYMFNTLTGDVDIASMMQLLSMTVGIGHQQSS